MGIGWIKAKDVYFYGDHVFVQLLDKKNKKSIGPFVEVGGICIDGKGNAYYEGSDGKFRLGGALYNAFFMNSSQFLSKLNTELGKDAYSELKKFEDHYNTHVFELPDSSVSGHDKNGKNLESILN